MGPGDIFGSSLFQVGAMTPRLLLFTMKGLKNMQIGIGADPALPFMTFVLFMVSSEA